MIFLLLLIWTHFVADFVLQTDSMALNKSHNDMWLGLHSLIYGAPFLWMGLEFALAAAVSHFFIDWATSRVNAKLWKAHKRHWFFVSIGFDQALHLTVLIKLMEVLR